MSAALHVLQPGESAPELTLPTVNQEGAISLADFRAMGRSVLIAFMRGLHCPFSRRQISILTSMKERLEVEDANIVVVVNTTLDRARLYFQHWPTQVVVVADPGVKSHRSFGLGETAILPDDTDPSSLRWPQTATMAELLKYSVTGHPELPQPMNIVAAMKTLNAKDGFQMTEADFHSARVHPALAIGQFLIDASGIVRWTFVEMPDSLSQMGRVPQERDVVAAARALRLH
ncbi:redoxin domain-containing protein [Variovorax paradoxus]|nr:redoxin domain-containing protein [Variovorax paradoxus]